MDLRLISISGKPPGWVTDATDEYVRRLPPSVNVLQIRLPLSRGRQRDSSSAINAEGQRLLDRVGPKDMVIALDEKGSMWTSRQLADRFRTWRESSKNPSFLIGGPDGLSAACRQRAELVWSLSALTLPHALVQVIMLEQFYRAFSINSGHPYHKD